MAIGTAATVAAAITAIALDSQASSTTLLQPFWQPCQLFS